MRLARAQMHDGAQGLGLAGIYIQTHLVPFDIHRDHPVVARGDNLLLQNQVGPGAGGGKGDGEQD